MHTDVKREGYMYIYCISLNRMHVLYLFKCFDIVCMYYTRVLCIRGHLVFPSCEILSKPNFT